MTTRTTTFRFYEELNDFLPRAHRKRDAVYRYTGMPSVKNAIEAQGVPHVEVDFVLVDGVSVGSGHLLRGDCGCWGSIRCIGMIGKTRISPRWRRRSGGACTGGEPITSTWRTS